MWAMCFWLVDEIIILLSINDRSSVFVRLAARWWTVREQFGHNRQTLRRLLRTFR